MRTENHISKNQNDKKVMINFFSIFWYDGGLIILGLRMHVAASIWSSIVSNNRILGWIRPD